LKNRQTIVVWVLCKAAKQVSYGESGTTGASQVGSSSHGHPNHPVKILRIGVLFRILVGKPKG
jgi:hypothetical protein